MWRDRGVEEAQRAFTHPLRIANPLQFDGTIEPVGAENGAKRVLAPRVPALDRRPHLDQRAGDGHAEHAATRDDRQRDNAPRSLVLERS